MTAQQLQMMANQATETGRQTKTLMVFTVVTIIFVCTELSRRLCSVHRYHILGHLSVPANDPCLPGCLASFLRHSWPPYLPSTSMFSPGLKTTSYRLIISSSTFV